MAEIRQDFEKKGFRSLGRESKNEAYPIKILAFKIFIFTVFQNHNFCQIFKKSYFIIFIDVWPLCYQDYTMIFLFLTMLYA